MWTSGLTVKEATGMFVLKSGLYITKFAIYLWECFEVNSLKATMKS